MSKYILKSILMLEFLFVAFSLSGCSPQDPAVLTAKEKADKARPRGSFQNNRFNNAERASLSANAELAGANLLVEKQTEILRNFAMALELSKSHNTQDSKLSAEVVKAYMGSCVRSISAFDDSENRPRSHVLSLDFSRCISKKIDKPEYSFQMQRDGSYKIITTYDQEGLVASILIQSYGDTGSDTFKPTTILRKPKNAKDSAMIVESFQYKLLRSRTDRSEWTLLDSQLVVSARLNLRDSETHIYKANFSGQIKLKSIVSTVDKPTATFEQDTEFEHNIESRLDLSAKKDSSEQAAFYTLRLTREPQNTDLAVDNLVEENAVTISTNQCGSQKGEYYLNFNYRYSKADESLSYSANEMKLNKSRDDKGKSLTLRRRACSDLQSEIATGKLKQNGYFPVDWALHFLN